jgi:Flp pilus assembly protein protease CpaA
MGRQLPTLSTVLLICLAGTAAVTDLLWRRIPNWATYSALLWGLLLNACHSLVPLDGMGNQLGTVGIRESLLGAGAMFLAAIVLFSITGGGAGDVKLLTALGSLLGLDLAIDAVLYGFVAAGAASVIWAVWRYGPLTLVRAVGRLVGSFLLPLWIDRPTAEQTRLLRLSIPLAPFFAAGTFLVLIGAPLSWWAKVFRF